MPPSITKTAPKHPRCALDHHTIGRKVSWTQWNHRLHVMDTLHGEVVDHRPDLRYIVIACIETGRNHRMPCGAVAPWRVTPGSHYLFDESSPDEFMGAANEASS